MFSAHLLRKKVFEQAKVTVKTHITGQWERQMETKRV
jgi:hypothetical protein